MLAVSFRKVVLSSFVFLLLCSAGLKAQRMHYFDTRQFNLGFTMGLNYGGYDMTSQVNQVDPSTQRLLYRVELIRKPGIYLGLITNMNIANNVDLRFMPSVSLEERDFNFYFNPETTQQNVSVVTKKIEASNLNLPLLIKFKSNYYKNTRVYVMFGIQPSFNLSSTKKVRNDPQLLKTQRNDLSYVASFGVDLYGEKLKLSPELRFTRGLRNLYVEDNTEFPKAISDLFSQLLVLNINFE